MYIELLFLPACSHDQAGFVVVVVIVVVVVGGGGGVVGVVLGGFITLALCCVNPVET